MGVARKIFQELRGKNRSFFCLDTKGKNQMSAFGAMPLTIIRKRERQKKSRLKKNMGKTAAG
jgi:hypothetical protein